MKRFEICVGCGKRWNVSVLRKPGWYICPKCSKQERQRRRRRQEDAAKGAPV